MRATLGGRCLSDLSPRREKEILGSVASDPTVSRLVGTLADRVEAVEAAEAGPARQRDSGRGPRPASTHRPLASGRTGVWADRPPVIDIDTTLVGVHSEK